MFNRIAKILNRDMGSALTQFDKLNADWNAHPVDPDVTISIYDNTLVFEFTLNNYVFPRFAKSQRASLTFRNCSRYRLGRTNDEGWYRGQCRFGTNSHRWGEFYAITGDSLLDKSPDDWKDVSCGNGTQHFLFYMKDDTFECFADGFEFCESAG